MCHITESARIYTTLSKYKNRNVRFINQRTKVVSTDPAELKIEKGPVHKARGNELDNQFSIASEGHSSTQAPQSTHFSASMTAMSSMVMASLGHASAHAPQATHLSAITVTI